MSRVSRVTIGTMKATTMNDDDDKDHDKAKYDNGNDDEH